ncbi:MAG TPA: HK97 family phage prohead protease [Acidimicrobiia bacterium]
MPYFITDSSPDCAGWATVKDDGEVMGCHETKQAAIDQMIAISVAEGIEPGGERDLPENYRPAVAEDVPEGRACGNCRFYDESNVRGDQAFCTRWDEYVDGGYYCNAWQADTAYRNLDGPPAIVVDIGMTLLDENDEPIANVVRFVDEYEGDVLIVSSKLEADRDAIIALLDSYDIDYDRLDLRESADADEVLYKSEQVKDLLDIYNIELAIENDPDVRAEYARIGITTLAPEQVDPAELPEMVERQVDLTLPQYIRDAAARGLELRAEGYGGEGLVERTIREARLMADGQVSEDKVIRVAAWAARHLVDLEAPANSDADADGWPGNGAVAFYLWGIDPLDPQPAIEWFERKRDQIREEDEMQDRRWYGDIAVRDRPGATLFRMENGVEQRRVTVNEFEVRDAQEGAGTTFVGLAAAFNAPSQPLPFIERIAPGAFSRSLRSRNEIKLFVNHDTSRVLASKRAGTLRLWESDRGLEVEADLPDTTDGRDMATLLKRGDVDSMSFGFSVPKGGDAWSDDGQERELREVRLHEVSIVTGWPAYEQTAASVRSLDGLVDATGLEAEKLNAAITALEKGETLDDELAAVLDEAVTKLRTERDDVAAKLAMKQKQLDVLLARV